MSQEAPSSRDLKRQHRRWRESHGQPYRAWLRAIALSVPVPPDADLVWGAAARAAMQRKGMAELQPPPPTRY